jgi:hypothetical protein
MSEPWCLVLLAGKNLDCVVALDSVVAEVSTHVLLDDLALQQVSVAEMERGRAAEFHRLDVRVNGESCNLDRTVFENAVTDWASGNLQLAETVLRCCTGSVMALPITWLVQNNLVLVQGSSALVLDFSFDNPRQESVLSAVLANAALFRVDSTLGTDLTFQKTISITLNATITNPFSVATFTFDTEQ